LSSFNLLSGAVGRVGWGLAWYVNGLLIPEITVVRGKTYTFVVEAGNDPDHPVKFHPFYITDDSEGGYAYKTDEQKRVNKQFFKSFFPSKFLKNF
jgi:hypothetical protein